jgi:uncharacterized protein
MLHSIPRAECSIARECRVAAGVAAVVTLALAGTLYAQPQLPDPTGRVNDFASILDAKVEADLDRLLQETEDKTTAEIAVVTVPTLQGASVEDYAERLFHTWGIGQEKVDNGVLVLVAPTERAMRIEVGYGLEGVLPDGLAGNIIDTTFVPHFRNDDYSRGIDQGVKRVAAVIQRNHVLTPEELRALADIPADRPPWFLMVPFLGTFIAVGFYMLGIGAGARVGFPADLRQHVRRVPDDLLVDSVFQRANLGHGPAGDHHVRARLSQRPLGQGAVERVQAGGGDAPGKLGERPRIARRRGLEPRSQHRAEQRIPLRLERQLELVEQ